MTETVSVEGDSWSDILLQYKSWLFFMARQIAPQRPDVHEDLAQEGYVAMWKALQSFDPMKGALPPWLTNAAKMRMKDVWRRDTWTGTPSARGHTREKPAVPVDTDWDWVDDALGASNLNDHLLMAYHEGEIHQAISGLTPRQREYVLRRFWADQTDQDIRKIVPNAPRVWSDAKVKLREDLAHLASASC